MKSIKTEPRIHPLMAAAALSVITVSIAGTAAITGLLPTSQGANTPTPLAAPAAAAPVSYVPAPVAAPAPLPAAARATAPLRVAAHDETPAKPKARPRPQPRHVEPEPEYTQVARNDVPKVHSAPQPAQPNYVGIGAGAVIGGLIGNQIGSGNGKKLATIAGIIGGGMIGNEIQNRTK